MEKAERRPAVVRRLLLIRIAPVPGPSGIATPLFRGGLAGQVLALPLLRSTGDFSLTDPIAPKAAYAGAWFWSFLEELA